MTIRRDASGLDRPAWKFRRMRSNAGRGGATGAGAADAERRHRWGRRSTSLRVRRVCEQARPEWSRSSEPERPVDPDPRDEWFRPDVRGLGFCRVPNGVFAGPYLY